MPANLWPKERDEHLKRLYAQVPRLSSSEIASELNCGVTRNAVIGRVHRLGLALRGQMKARPKVKKIRKRSTQMRVAPIDGIPIEMRCADAIPLGISLVELEIEHCRYPDGDGPFTFCGQQRMDGSSYCHSHSALSITKSRSNSEAVTEARARRMRGINFRRSLLEAI